MGRLTATGATPSARGRRPGLGGRVDRFQTYEMTAGGAQAPARGVN